MLVTSDFFYQFFDFKLVLCFEKLTFGLHYQNLMLQIIQNPDF